MNTQNSISKETIEEFLRLVEGGLRRRDAAHKVGFVLRHLRDAAEEYGISSPVFLPTAEAIKHFEADILERRITQYELAQKLGIAQPNLTKLYRKNGYPSIEVGRRSNLPTELEMERQAQQVVEHLVNNGGYIKPTIRELGFTVDRARVKKYAQSIGINLTEYRFAHRKYGHWVTLPGLAERAGKSSYKVKAKCTLCGEIFTVSLANMKSGRSNCCHVCAHARRNDFSVECAETGDKYSSIMSCCSQIGLSNSDYQRTRIVLLKDGIFKHGGLSYRLISKVRRAEAVA